MKCQATGCFRTATHMPQIVLYAQGWPQGTHDPGLATIGLKLCRRHAEAFELTTEGQKGIRDAFVAQRRLEPDFERAEVRAVTIAAGEAQQAKAAAQQPN